LYGLADGAGSVVFTRNDGEAPVMIVDVGPDWSVATLMMDRSWYSYLSSDAEGFAVIDLGGQSCEWPRAKLPPRAATLPVLMTAGPDSDQTRFPRRHAPGSAWCVPSNSQPNLRIYPDISGYEVRRPPLACNFFAGCKKNASSAHFSFIGRRSFTLHGIYMLSA